MSASSTGPGRVGGLLGLLSTGMLAASIVWVHHWGARSDTIVGVWAVSTLGALWVSRWTLRTSDESRALAKLGIALALVSVLALVFAGIAYAAGANPAGACGGG